MPAGHCAHQLEFKRIMLSLPKINDSLIDHESPRGGFALVIALGLMAFVLLLLLSITTLVQVEARSSKIQMQQMEAEQVALLGLQIALGELQKTAGPDQRVSATADLLSNDSSKEPVDGRHRWAGVWDTRTYSPAEPDTKMFMRWLVSTSEANGLVSASDAKSETFSNSCTIFEGVDASGIPDPVNDVIVEKVSISNTGSSSNESFYAYWVEDQGVKADLEWNEGIFTDDARQQSARLSSAPGVDYGVFASDDSSPFKDEVAHPLEQDGSNNLWLANISKVVSSAGLPALTGSNTDATDWLKSVRHDLTFGSRAVLCDVKHGGLRRDLSLAFEMDGEAESENASLFNQQAREFVGNEDPLSSPYVMPGTLLYARHLFRDTPSAGDVFSADITQAATVVRGPSWWLLRDYANLYKRLKTSGTGHSLEARAYFPNRTTPTSPGNSILVEDLMDIHADNQWMNWKYGPIKVSPTNRETNGAGNYYAYRPIRANYAPVLLGVNAIYSLIYKDGKLQMTVDPFFILWNPYNVQVTADRFAVTLENGLAGGVRFKVTDAEGNVRFLGKPSAWGGWRGSDTSFADFAKHRFKQETTRNGSANLSYLITDLTMQAGEVLIYSPPKEADRESLSANVLNDALVPGMNFDATTSGIFFDEFPDKTGGNWGTVTLSADETVDVLFNVASQSGSAVVNIIETNLPPSGSKADELTDEAKYGDHVAGQEFRLNFGGNIANPNVNLGAHGFTQRFDSLNASKKSFGLLSMLTLPTDFEGTRLSMEAFSQLNATPIVRTQLERFARAPLNIAVKTVTARDFNELMEKIGFDLPFSDEDEEEADNNGFYGKSYDMVDGDITFPLIGIPQSPLHSLVQLSGANIGTRLFEPTHAIGNSWKPPYIPGDSIYHNSAYYMMGWYQLTLNDVSWQSNDALFDRYYLSGIAPSYSIGLDGYTMDEEAASAGIQTTLQSFYGGSPELAKVNPALEPYLPEGMTATEIEDLLTPEDGYQKLGAYSLINGAFNVNSTSVAAWSALLRGNKSLAMQSIQGTTDSELGTPFPLSSSVSDTTSTNEWEQFSRLTDEQIWNDQGTPEASDDTGLAVEIVNQVKARGPFMSLSDFVNRRISEDSRSAQGAIQEAIEQAGINGDQAEGIRFNTSETIPNYSNFPSDFPYAGPVPYDTPAPYVGNRNNATGVPLEINQANILLPIAAKLSARSDTFKIRAYGEVVSTGGDVVKAMCEAAVQRVPEYLDTETNPDYNQPWDEYDTDPATPANENLNPINQAFGRKFEIIHIRWLDQAEI
jgi:hypothetical protein